MTRAFAPLAWSGMPRPPPITRAKPAFVVRSDELDTDYAVYVHAPPASGGEGPWPALALIDGDYAFDWAVAAYEQLRTAGQVPPLVLAAVGYGEPFGSPRNHRGRDYTPDAAPEEPSSGGADRFLAHLSGPIWKELASQYPLRDDLRGIAGHSLSGLLALHALFQPRPFFNRALVGAPSLWWADRRFFARVEKLRRRTPSLPARLFLGIGEHDTESMKDDYTQFENRLAAAPFTGLEIVSRRFPNRDHYDVTPDLFRAGLVALFSS